MLEREWDTICIIELSIIGISIIFIKFLMRIKHFKKIPMEIFDKICDIALEICGILLCLVMFSAWISALFYLIY